MEATRDDIEGLFELQRIDLEIKRLSKELDELPQRGIIVAARDKKAAIEAKSEQVAELKRATTKKITRIDDEDASLAKKEAGVQAAIDAAHGDFRNVEARTKELAGIVRRRATIAEDRAAVAAELDKISAMEAQISLALEEIGAKEQEAIDSFQKQGGDLKLAIAKLEAAAARWRRRSPRSFWTSTTARRLAPVWPSACSTATAAAPAARSSTAAVSSICATRHRWVCAPRASVCW